MSKGIIYIMTSAVPGLIKIGKNGSANGEISFKTRFTKDTISRISQSNVYSLLY